MRKEHMQLSRHVLPSFPSGRYCQLPLSPATKRGQPVTPLHAILGNFFPFLFCTKVEVQGSRIRLVLGCVISPLRQHEESRNLGQTLFGSPVKRHEIHARLCNWK